MPIGTRTTRHFNKGYVCMYVCTSPDKKLHHWVYEELIYPFQHHRNIKQNATHTSNHDKKNGNPLNLNQLVSGPTPGTPISINKYDYCPVFSNSNYRYMAHPIKKKL